MIEKYVKLNRPKLKSRPKADVENSETQLRKDAEAILLFKKKMANVLLNEKELMPNTLFQKAAFLKKNEILKRTSVTL